jgi:WD40 repeat protein
MGENSSPARPGDLIKAGMALLAEIREASNGEKPQITNCAPAIKALRARAFRLASEGREDAKAVAELRRMARRNARRLRQASASVRSRAWVNENLLVYQANQLLRSAMTGEPVVAVTTEQRAYFERIAGLAEGGNVRGFRRLVELVPELADIARTTKAETRNDGQARIKQALTPLVGPDAHSENDVVGSHTAYDIAFTYLTNSYAGPPARIATLSGHTARINHIRQLRSGGETLLVTADEGGTAVLWDLANGERRATLSGHTGPISAITRRSLMRPAATPPSDDWPDEVIVTAGTDGTVRTWDITTGEPLVTYDHSAPVVAMTWRYTDGSPWSFNLFTGRTRTPSNWQMVLGIAAGADGTVAVLALRTGDLRATLAGHLGPLTDIVTSDLGREALVVTASTDGTARVWDLTTMATRHVLTGHNGPITALAYRGDNDTDRYLVTAGADGTARIWNPSSGKQLLVINGHTPLTDVALAGWDLVLTSSLDGTAHAYDFATGKERFVFLGHDGPVDKVGSTEVDDTTCAVTLGTDRTLRVWSLTDGQQLAMLSEVTAFVSGWAGDDQQIIITGAADGTVRVWDTADLPADSATGPAEQ